MSISPGSPKVCASTDTPCGSVSTTAIFTSTELVRPGFFDKTARQYAPRKRAVALCWKTEEVMVIDSDLGQSGAVRTSARTRRR